MKKAKRYFLAGVVAMLLGGMSAAWAGEKDSYIGFGLGVFSPGDAAYDSAMGWKVIGGSVINRHLSLQLGYVDFGEMNGPLNDVGKTMTISTTGFEFSAMGHYPFADRYSVFAKLGFLVWNSAWRNRGPTSGTVTTGDATLLYGLGGRFDWSSSIGFVASWEHFSLDDDTTAFSGSVVYSF